MSKGGRGLLLVVVCVMLAIGLRADIPPVDTSEVHAVLLESLSTDVEDGGDQTSTDSVLKLNREQLIESLDQKKYAKYISTLKPESHVIPGLKQTRFGEGEVCNTMVPQGVCIAGKYLLISAYDSVYKVKGRSKYYKAYSHERHSSVLYVMERETGRYLTTLVLGDSKCHVGSIAYNEDDDLLYVADSDYGYVWELDFQDVIRAVWDCGLYGTDPGYLKLAHYFKVKNRPSALCYYRGRVYVGECADNFSNSFNNRMFVYTPDGLWMRDSTIDLPYHTQGVGFAELDDRIYMLVSCSRGRYMSSTLYIYSIKESEMDLMVQDTLAEIPYPNMSEDIAVDGEDVLSCYESGSNFYHIPLDGVGISRNPVDRIMVNSVRELLD